MTAVRRAAGLVAVLVTVAACSAQSEDTATPTTAACAPQRQAGIHAESGLYNGEQRTWQLSMPDGSPKGLVFDFHGTGGDIATHDSITRLSEDGAARGYAVVTPQALENPTRWTVPGIPGPDDVAFVEALAAQLVADLCVVGPTIATGKSSGAAMATQLACVSDQFSIVAPVAGVNLYRRCPTGPPKSVITFHGTADAWVPFEGPEGWQSAEQEEGTYFIGDVEASVEAFAERAGCDEPTATRLEPDTTVSEHSCAAGNRVALYTIEAGGHTHPGSHAAQTYEAIGATESVGRTSTTFDGTDTMLDFFDQVIDERTNE